MNRFALAFLPLLFSACGGDDASPPSAASKDAARDPRLRCATAMMEGRSADALAAAREAVASEPVEVSMALPYFVRVRFGKWDEILAEKPPDAKSPLATAIWHFARGMALAAKQDLEGSLAEQFALAQVSSTIPKEAKFGLNDAGEVLLVAMTLLSAVSSKLSVAIREESTLHRFRMAARIEDRLRDAQPADWMLPVRHWLGAALLDVGKAAEAEEVYREDLRRNHENGWALRGLVMALKAQKQDATEIEVRFLKAWKKADVEIKASRF